MTKADFNEVEIIINNEVVAKSSGPTPALELVGDTLSNLASKWADRVGLKGGIRKLNLHWGEHERDGGTHAEWHAPCGCAYHPNPFPHIHPCSSAHKRPDLHSLAEETESERVSKRRRALMPDYDKALEDWLS